MTRIPHARRQLMLALACTTIGVSLAGCSSGGTSLGDVDRVFLSAAGSWDRNRDGVVTCDEWRAYADELFRNADANHDGYVDSTEYQTIIKTDRMFQTVEMRYYDSNNDKKIDYTEFVEKPNRAFALLDQTNKCVLNADQVAGARAHTEQVFDSKKPESGDPREKKTPGIN